MSYLCNSKHYLPRRLHTENNIKAVKWSQDYLKADLRPYNIVVDFGCGTGETAAHIGSLEMFGPCQVVGLDINLEFIKHCTLKYRLNMVSYFWNQHPEDFVFLKNKVSIVTCFSVLHILPPTKQKMVIDFMKDILTHDGQILVLHYLGRTESCFQAYLEIHIQLQTKTKWRPYLKKHHRTLCTLESEAKTAASDLIQTMKKAGMRLTTKQELASSVIVNVNTIKTILSNPSIRRLEFGQAYDDIPVDLYGEFASEFCELFKNFFIKNNSKFMMAIFQVV